MNLFHGVVLALLLLLTGQFTVPQYTGATATPRVLNPCLVSAWPMNEGSGLTLNDTVGGNTATISASAAVTWQSNAGLPGITPLWNGSGNALATSTTLTNFTNTTPFSVALWAKVGPGATMIGTLNTSAAFKGWEFSTGAGGQLTFFLDNSFSGNALVMRGASSVTGVLHYFVATTDGTGTPAGTHFYIDGVLDSSPVILFNSLTTTIANGLPARFGARMDGTTKLSGPMAFVEVYNCVPSPTFWAANFASGPGIY